MDYIGEIDNWELMKRMLGGKIYLQDNRSSNLPKSGWAEVVGLRLDSVELRTNGNLTNWYHFNHTKIKFYLSQPNNTKNDKQGLTNSEVLLAEHLGLQKRNKKIDEI